MIECGAQSNPDVCWHCFPFAEKYMSSEGGSRLFYKLLGVLIMIGSIMYAVDLLDPILESLARLLVGNRGL